jgi:hypothetical protein
MTPTGSNLLGILRHLSGIEHAYLGETFGRSLPPQPLPEGWDEELWHNGDMWVRPSESSESILDSYKQSCTHADDTIRTLDLDSPGSVPHWPKGNKTTLGAMIVRVLAKNAATAATST